MGPDDSRSNFQQPPCFGYHVTGTTCVTLQFTLSFLHYRSKHTTEQRIKVSALCMLRSNVRSVFTGSEMRLRHWQRHVK